MKRLVFLLLVFALVLSLASCAMLKGDKGDQGIPGRDGKDGKDGETPTISISEDGYWVINGIKTWYKANGTNGKDGAPGKDGVDGITPTIEISADGYWIINGIKTDCKAEGTPGKDGEDGKDGIDGAPGQDGTPGTPGQDGITPTLKLVEGQILVSYDGGKTWESLGNVNDDICNHRDIDDNYLCDKCEKPYADGTDVPADPEHTHSYGDWRYYGTCGEYCEDALFYRTCPGCNVIEWRDGTESDHIYSTVTTASTCISIGYDTKTCSKCHKVVVFNETAKTAHTYATTYKYDASYHWMQCTYCADVKDRAEHIIDGNGFCIICMQPLGPTAGIVYDASIDGTYAEVIGYNGTATQIVIADTYNGLPVKNIMDSAFYDNDNITSVLIPDSVTTIGSSAFSNCSGLTSIIIPDSVTEIGYSAFRECSRLTSVVIGDSVTTIGNDAFRFCSGLTSVTIGNGITSIGSSAFSNCNSALYTEYEYGKYVGDASNPYAVLYELTNKNFTTYTIHEDTKHIAYGVFESCARLSNIAIPDSVKSIGDSAFYDCYNLTSVVIGDSVTSIGDHAFCECSNLKDVYITDVAAWCNISFGDIYSNPLLYYAANLYLNSELITELVIPDGVTKISAYVFYNCSNLTSVVIGDSVTSIGYEAFYYCSKLKTVYYKGTAEDWANISIDSNGNYNLTDATRYYYSEAQPTESGRFWHYDENGDIAVW